MPDNPCTLAADSVAGLLRPLRYVEGSEERRRLADFLATRNLPPPALPTGDGAALQVALTARGDAVQAALLAYYRNRRRGIEQNNRNVEHSFQTFHAHTRLVDALHRAAFDLAWDDLPSLLELRRREWQAEQQRVEQQLTDKLGQLETFRRAQQTEAPGGELEHKYYRGIESGLLRETEEWGHRMESLGRRLTALADFVPDPDQTLHRLVVFARGGYGRAELGFESDLDTGYCLDPRGLPPGGKAPYREVVLRMESLLRGGGLDTAHQYFELDENLARFTLPETQHTVTSVLEGRMLLGSPVLMDALKQRFRQAFPLDEFVSAKLEELNALRLPGVDRFDIKCDIGGLRNIQVPLWLLAHAEGLADWGSAEVLAHGVSVGLISAPQARRLTQALEILSDIRNTIAVPSVGDAPCSTGASGKVSGEASRGVTVDPAAESTLGTHGAHGVLTAMAAQRYLELRPRFEDRTALMRHVRRVVADVQGTCNLITARVLDRTMTTTVAGLRLTTHLHRKLIVDLDVAVLGGAGPSLTLRECLRDTGTVLGLLQYMAESGYQLSTELTEQIGSSVLQPAPITDLTGRETEQLYALVAAPYAHRAVMALHEINVPVSDGVATLMGRVLPQCDGAYYLVREALPGSRPLHQRMEAAMEEGERRLQAFREDYPEWASLLGQQHTLALKWSLLLHPLSLLEADRVDHARSAELAGETLLSLGPTGREIEPLVRLLVEQQSALIALTRAAPFVDLALAEYFDLAQRDVATAVLIYIVNGAVHAARGIEGDLERDDLSELFDEAMRILASLQVIPTNDRTIALINLYFDARKADAEREVRLYLVARRVVTQGPATGLGEILSRPEQSVMRAEDDGKIDQAGEAEPAIVARLNPLYRRIVLGQHRNGERERLVVRLVQTLGRELEGEGLRRLTEESALSWFFASFPNRYLLRTPPSVLAQQIVKFGEYAERPVLVDLVAGQDGMPAALLVAVRGLPHAHARVTYALALRRFNILSGKVNRVTLPSRGVGFCYWFQVSPPVAGATHAPRDLESLILDPPPADAMPRLTELPGALALRHTAHATRVEYLEDDGRGYRVVCDASAFRRQVMPYAQIRVTRHDEPFLFYGLCRMLDHHEVELQQAVVTTTGNLVTDTFYLEREEAERLSRSTLASDIVQELDVVF